MNLNPEIGMSRSVGLALLVLGALFLWQRYKRNNSLSQHLAVEESTQENGSVVSAMDNAAIDAYPLSTVGVEPFTGLMLDPFFENSPANEIQPMWWNQSKPQSKMPDDQSWFSNIIVPHR